jgi:hypothetical protein
MYKVQIMYLGVVARAAMLTDCLLWDYKPLQIGGFAYHFLRKLCFTRALAVNDDRQARVGSLQPLFAS